MASYLEQLELASHAVSRGDIDSLAAVLADPSTATPDQTATIAESLGIQGGMARFMVNTALDPIVWTAALLSRKFPAYLGWGGIPKAYIGSAMELTGLSRIFRPVSTVFRGHGIEEQMSIIMHRQSKNMATFKPLIEGLSSLSDKEVIDFARSFDPDAGDIPLTPLTRKVRETHQETMTLWHAKLSETANVQGGLAAPGTDGSMEWGPHGKAFSSIDPMQYLPRMAVLSPDGTYEISATKALARMAKAGGKTFERAMAADGLKYRVEVDPVTKNKYVAELGPWKVNVADDTLAVDRGEFYKMMRGQTGKVFFGHLKQRKRDVPLFSPEASGDYVLDYRYVMAEYARNASRTHALNAPLTAEEMAVGFPVENPNPKIPLMVNGKPTGRFADAFIRQPFSSEPPLVQIIRKGLESMGVQVEEQAIHGTTKRVIRYKLNGDDAIRYQSLEHLVRSLKGTYNERDTAVGFLLNNAADGLDKTLRATKPDLIPRVADFMQYLRTSAAERTVSNFLAHNVYWSTLGANAGPVFGNGMQTALTTMPQFGLGPTLKGALEFAERIPAYIRRVGHHLRNRNPRMGLSDSARGAQQAALHEAYPEFERYHLDARFSFADMNPGDITPADNGYGFKIKKMEGYLNWLMAPFQGVETTNRGVGWFAAKSSFTKAAELNPRMIPEGVNVDDFIGMQSAQGVNRTQFLPGGGTRTIAQDWLPPWLRTFTSFPIRLISSIGESTVRGAMTEAEYKMADSLTKALGRRNWGPLSRMALAGQITKNGFRDVLGVDVAKYVGLGPLDADNDLGPFSLPPLAGLAINTAQAINEREWDRTQPAHVPGIGSIGIPKVLVPGGVAMTRLARAMEQFSTEAGGFVDENDQLMRTGGVSDAIMGALGIPTERGRRERMYRAQLKSNSADIKDYRRRFAGAILRADLDQAAEIRGQYGKRYPELKFLNVDADDLKRHAMNAQIPALARALKSLGKEPRALFGGQIANLDPDLLGLETE